MPAGLGLALDTGHDPGAPAGKDRMDWRHADMRMWLLPIRVIAGMLAWLGQAFARDQQVKTYASAKSARHIPGARFVGYEHGGHLWVGHHTEVMAEFLHS
jgi:hypothetical protein